MTITCQPLLVMSSIMILMIITTTTITTTTANITFKTSSPLTDDDTTTTTTTLTTKQRIQKAKMTLWQHGAFALDERALLGLSSSSSNDDDDDDDDDVNDKMIAEWFENTASLAYMTWGPVRQVRRSAIGDNDCGGGGGGVVVDGRMSSCDDLGGLLTVRGGGGDDGRSSGGETGKESMDELLERLGETLGEEFKEAVELNKKEHEEDCQLSCESFYCATDNDDDDDDSNEMKSGSDDFLNGTTFVSYSMGAVPPEDFADDFGFPLDLIKVSQNQPLIPPSEAHTVTRTAASEGLLQNEYTSGKYKLGGDWLLHLPQTRAWFNQRCRTTFFPLLRQLFPEIVSSVTTLRAHSVSLLRYNETHPRTDVHVDNGILAMTVVMSERGEYEGGGTFFEHMGEENVVHMDVGHGTFRPGSIRHGGHPVTHGNRYVLGAFLLLSDRVEHVRRLKNRGAALRRQRNDLSGAEKHFRWALSLNPKCTTCLKDLTEIYMSRKEYNRAEGSIREALRLLEDSDSDALFTLGVILSELKKDDESIEAYMKSVRLNGDDAELCYNLGIKLGQKGRTADEMSMYKKATTINSSFGGAWINWGTTLAEKGDYDEAESKFTTATECCPDVAPKAYMNLALIHHARAKDFAATAEFTSAKSEMMKASERLHHAKTLIDNNNDADDNNNEFAAELSPLRLQTHQLTGQILAAMGDYEGTEKEYNIATANFPNEPRAWFMLSRILELRGKTEEAQRAKDKLALLQSMSGMFGS